MLKWLVAKSLQRYWRISRGLTMGAQGCVLDGAGHVLLVRHTYRDGWHFPGGGVERNEFAIDALRRELKEEANVTLDDAPELFGVYGNFKAFPSDHIALFVVRAFTLPELPKANAEIAACEWFAIDNLPDGAVDGVRRRLTEITTGAPRANAW